MRGTLLQRRTRKTGGATAAAGTLAAIPSAGSVAPNFVYFATDDNGGTAYRSDGVSTWTKIAPGLSASPKGVLGSVKVTTSLSVVFAGSWVDITGHSATFTYNGRPIIVASEISGCKYGSTSVNWQIKAVDVSSGKDVCATQGTTPSTATFAFTPMLRSIPLQAMADGTALVSGQSYTFKLQWFAGGNSTLTAALAASSIYFGHLEIIEA